MATAWPPDDLRLHVTTRVLELTERDAAGDLAARAELEALAALLERNGR